jgi:hypothetical protein
MTLVGANNDTFYRNIHGETQLFEVRWSSSSRMIGIKKECTADCLYTVTTHGGS